jgi:hypothetical protein
LALTNNKELFHLLTSNGHIAANVNDVNSIKQELLNLYENYQEIRNNVKPIAIDIIKQTENLLS